jgi:hypothetical protein
MTPNRSVPLFAALLFAGALAAQSNPPTAPAPAAPAPLSEARSKALAWLATQQKGGVFTLQMRGREIQDPGLSALGLMALQTKPKELRTAEEQATIDQGLAWLLQQQNEDGTFGKSQPNYVTCVAIGAMTRAGNPAHQEALQRAQKSILLFQHLEANGYKPSDPDYGSIGYGGKTRGDLSNLHFSLEALRDRAAGDHEAFAKALVFLQRTQNLKSDQRLPGKVAGPGQARVRCSTVAGDDGGAVYYPGNSPPATRSTPTAPSCRAATAR